MSAWDKLINWLYGTKASTAPVVAIPTEQPGTGALLDTRTPEQQQADIQFSEIVASASVVNWVLKTVAQFRTFPAFNQTTCDACVAFTMAKLLGVMQWLKTGTFVTFSPSSIYNRRSNAGTPGMNNTDPYSIAAQGVTLDILAPSQNLNEAQINAVTEPQYVQDIGTLFKLSNSKGIVLPTGNIEAIASVIQQTGKAVMVWFYFTAREWEANVEGTYSQPQVLDTLSGAYDSRSLRHSVAAVDYTLLANGKKALVIEDSAWFGGLNRRVIDEDFFTARNFFAAYPMNFSNTVSANGLPKYTFTKSLSFIAWDSVANAPANQILNAAQLADVKALQTVLQAMKDDKGNSYFPTNIIPTGYYGALTATAVYNWGCDHLLATVPQATLDSLAGKLFGEASIAEMNTELI